jgi:hypothetical protein
MFVPANKNLTRRLQLPQFQPNPTKATELERIVRQSGGAFIVRIQVTKKIVCRYCSRKEVRHR